LYSLYHPSSLVEINVDSNFILPPDVTIEFDVNSSNDVNIQPLAADNNPQAGSLAPEAFLDINLDTVPDPLAVSGYVFHYISVAWLMFSSVRFGHLRMGRLFARMET